MELMVNQCNCVDEIGTQHTFQYFLLQDRLVTDTMNCEDFGVRVCSDAGEEARVPHITSDRRRIDRLITLLCEHEVSPTHLHDVIEDWL